MKPSVFQDPIKALGDPLCQLAALAVGAGVKDTAPAREVRVNAATMILVKDFFKVNSSKHDIFLILNSSVSKQSFISSEVVCKNSFPFEE